MHPCEACALQHPGEAVPFATSPAAQAPSLHCSLCWEGAGLGWAAHTSSFSWPGPT